MVSVDCDFAAFIDFAETGRYVGQAVDTYTTAEIRAFSFSLVDTNIFGPKASLPIEYVYLAVGAAAVGVVLALAGVVVVVRNRRAKKLKPKPWSRSPKRYFS